MGGDEIIDDDDYYEDLINKMDALYPKAPFSFNVEDYNNLDEILVEKDNALFYHKHSCFCWCDVREENNIRRRPK